MIEIEPKRWKLPPFKHQLDGVKAIVRNNFFALFDEMGTCKTKQVIDAACTLYQAGDIDMVVVVAPANVKTVWTRFDETEPGELQKHAWLPVFVMNYGEKRSGGGDHARWHKVWETQMDWKNRPPGTPAIMNWIVTNYEQLRSKATRDEFMMHIGESSRMMLVLDESSYIKSKDSAQTKGIADLRKIAHRCVLLNGTPIANNPLDLWSQCDILNWKILGRHYQNYFHFRYSIAIIGGHLNKQVLGFRELEVDRVSKIISPHCLRRLKVDCLDLPPKIFTEREIKLDKESWARYKILRTECLLALPAREMLPEPNAAVRLMRLSQLCSGHVSAPPKLDTTQAVFEFDGIEPEIVDVSSEKIDWCADYLKEWSSADASIVWCRFRRERERLVEALDKLSIPAFELYGGQAKRARDEAVAAFMGKSGGRRRVLVAQPHAGGLGLNLTAATEAIYLSNDYSLTARLQSEDRCHRQGTITRIHYIDALATGPEGQRTIDHIVWKALKKKETLANWTANKWRKELNDD